MLFFASLRDGVGQAEAEVQATRVSEILPALEATLSAAGLELLREANVRIAVNQTLVETDLPLQHGDEVAFLPPVTGG